MDANATKQKKAYNEHFEEYDVAVSRTHELYKPHAIDKWKQSFANKSILDLGCGNAYILKILLDSNIDFKLYTGIDISDSMTEHNIKTYKNLKNVKFIVNDAEKLSTLSNNQFDVVVSYGCIHHLTDTEKSIQRIFDVLKPGGKLYANVMILLSKFFLRFDKFNQIGAVLLINANKRLTPQS